MKVCFIAVMVLLFAQLGYGSDLSKFAEEVPTAKLDLEVQEYLANELAFTGSFKSDYTIAEYKEVATGSTWYIVDGYFTLPDQTVLFLDFVYSPKSKAWRAIDNYSFVPNENKRFLLKAEEVCNPYKRNFIGVLAVEFTEEGHIDELIKFLKQTLGQSPVFYTDGRFHMIQDLTSALGSKPLFSLKEEALQQQLKGQSYIYGSMIIPSGREPSNDTVSKTYVGVTPACKK